MGDWGEIVIFSIFGCKSDQMATFAGMHSENQQMIVAKDNEPSFPKRT